MARFTSLEFMEALGLGYFDYNGAKILLRLLASKGIAKPVDKIKPAGGKGRHLVVYEIPEEITLNVTPPATMPSHPPKKRKKKDEIAEVQEEVCEEQVHEEVCEEQAHEVHEVEPVAVKAETQYEWDDGWEDD